MRLGMGLVSSEIGASASNCNCRCRGGDLPVQTGKDGDKFYSSVARATDGALPCLLLSRHLKHVEPKTN
jgi:hypothetical protein